MGESTTEITQTKKEGLGDKVIDKPAGQVGESIREALNEKADVETSETVTTTDKLVVDKS